VLIQALISKLAIERLGERVVGGFALARELQLHPALIRLGIDSLGDELRPVVDGDPLRRPHRPLQDRGHLLAGLTRLTVSTIISPGGAAQ
jgi:hypothetical protein